MRGNVWCETCRRQDLSAFPHPRSGGSWGPSLMEGEDVTLFGGTLLCFHWCHRHHGPQQFEEERFYFTLQIRVHYPGKPSPETQAWVWSRNYGGMVLTVLHPLSCSTTFLIKASPTYLGMALPTVDWASTTINKQEHAPRDKSTTGQCDDRTSSVEVPFFPNLSQHGNNHKWYCS